MGGLPSLLGSSVGKKISTDVLLARAAVVAVTVAVSISPVMAVRVVCRSAVAVKMWTAKITVKNNIVLDLPICAYTEGLGRNNVGYHGWEEPRNKWQEERSGRTEI